MDGINSILPAGNDAIAISGWNDGAALRSEVTILRASTLRPILQNATDSTFLGVRGDRAYIDDWCCFGRGDDYSPATIYSVSLKDGTQSPRVNLAPDAQLHPGNQPLGLGAHNYMIGDYFYVVVPPVTYRYDLRDLKKAPVPLSTPTPGPQTEKIEPITPFPQPTDSVKTFPMSAASSANGPHLTTRQRTWIHQVAQSRNYRDLPLRFVVLHGVNTPIVVYANVPGPGGIRRGGHVIGEACQVWFDPVAGVLYPASEAACSPPTPKPVN